MFNSFNPMNRNYFASPTYKRGFQADSGAYGGVAPSLNYQMSPQQMYAPAGPQFMGMPQYGGDQMYGNLVPPGYRQPQFGMQPRMRFGQRLGRFTPYMRPDGVGSFFGESVQPFAGIE